MICYNITIKVEFIFSLDLFVAVNKFDCSFQQVDDPYCSKVPGGFASIEGLQPIFSRSIISLNDVYLSSIAVIAQKGSTAIIVSSADGVLRKVCVTVTVAVSFKWPSTTKGVYHCRISLTG